MGGAVDPNSTMARPMSPGTVDPQGESGQINASVERGLRMAGYAQALKGAGGSKAAGRGGTSPYSPSYPDETGPMARGGKIRRTSGPRIGRDDGLIPAQKGEYVVRKSAVKKLGTGVLNTINKGRLPQKAKRR
jgi:hypothetical protein